MEAERGNFPRPQFAETPFRNLRRLRLVYTYLVYYYVQSSRLPYTWYTTMYSVQHLSRKMRAAICGDLRPQNAGPQFAETQTT